MPNIKAFLTHPVWHYSPTQIATLVKGDWNNELVPARDHRKLEELCAQQHEALAGCVKRLRIELATRNGEPEPVFDTPAPSRLENLKQIASAMENMEKYFASQKGK